jgi:DNA-binding NtrC family response regulator
MAPARILIAEDERSIRSLLRTYLVAEGYEVLEAINGQETMDALTQTPPPDIVLLDLSMPAPQGMEILHRLKNMVVRPRPRIIVLTGNGSVQRAVEAMQLGATFFLEKPCKPEHLLSVIQGALDNKVLAEAITPEGYQAALGRARKYLADGKLAKAESYLRSASQFANHDAEYFYLLGALHELNGEAKDARVAFQQAIEFNHRHRLAQAALRRLGT